MKVRLSDQEKLALGEESRSVIYYNDAVGLFNKWVVKDAVELLGQASTRQIHIKSQKIIEDYVKRHATARTVYEPTIEDNINDFNFGERTTRRMLAKLLREDSIFKLDHGLYCSKKFYERYQAIMDERS